MDLVVSWVFLARSFMVIICASALLMSTACVCSPTNLIMYCTSFSSKVWYMALHGVSFFCNFTKSCFLWFYLYYLSFLGSSLRIRLFCFRSTLVIFGVVFSNSSDFTKWPRTSLSSSICQSCSLCSCGQLYWKSNLHGVVLYGDITGTEIRQLGFIGLKYNDTILSLLGVWKVWWLCEARVRKSSFNALWDMEETMLMVNHHLFGYISSFLETS